MNFAIIGYGTIGKTHAQVLSHLEGAALTAIATRDPAKARAAGEAYGCAWYTDYREMLKRDDIDVVTICTPAVLHLPMALDVAAAGKHCVVEKPIEIDPDRALQMIRAFEDRGLTLSVIFQHRFDPASQALKAAIDAGALGPLRYGTAKTVWFRDEAYYRASIWRGAWDGDGGGALMNQAIHSIDLLQYLMGPVRAVCGRYDTLAHDIPAEDIGLALLRFESGALGVVEGMTLAWPGRPAEVAVYGQDGSAGIQDDVLAYYALRKGADAQLDALLRAGKEDGARHPSFVRQYQDVISAIREGRAPLVTGRSALHAVQIVQAIYRSSREDRWVEL